MSDAGRAGLEQVVDALRRRRWPILFVLAVVSTASAGLATGLPNVYSGTATILVEPAQGLEGPTPDDVRTQLQRMSEEIESREPLVGLMDRFGLYAGLRRVLSEVAVLERMRRDIRIELKGPDQSGGRAVVAFTLSYRSTDPAVAAQVANALAEMYVDADWRLRGGVVEALTAQLGEVKARLEEQDRQVGEFQERFKGELPQQLQSNMATLERLDSQLRIVGEARVRAMERRSALVRQQAAEPGQAGSSGKSREAQIEKLRAQLAELKRTYTDKYPDVVRLQADLDALEKEKGTEPHATADVSGAGSPAIQAVLQDVDAEVKGLADEEERLRNEAQAYRQRVEDAPRRQQDFQRNARDNETTRELYNALLKRLQESQLSTQNGMTSRPGLRLLEPAQPPREPVGPKRLQLGLLGLMLAVGAAGVLTAVAEKADSSFHSVQDLREFTRVTVLATIPVTFGPRRALRRACLRVVAVAAGLACLVVVGRISHRVARANPDVASLVLRSP